MIHIYSVGNEHFSFWLGAIAAAAAALFAAIQGNKIEK